MTWLWHMLIWIFQSRTSRRNIIRRLDDYASYVQEDRRRGS